MAKRKPKTPYQLSKKKCWDAFSRYIRLKYSDNGWCTCVTCPKKGWWTGDGFQAGHGISGRGNGVLFLEEVVRPQCFSCNSTQNNGMYNVYVPLLIEWYGQDGYDEFMVIKNQSKKYTKEELDDMRKEFDDFSEEKLKEI